MKASRYISILVLVLFVLTLVPLVCFNVSSDPFGGNKAILNANYRQYQPAIAISGSGGTAQIHTVWTDQQAGITTGDIFYSRSTNGGSTFSIPMRINNGDYASNNSDDTSPDVAISGSYVYLVWKDSSQGQTHVYFRSSSDSGASFGTEKSIVAATGSDPSPKIEASGNNVYVCWQGKNSEGILCIMSSNNGGAFGSPATVQGALDQRISKHPDIAVDSTNVYVTFDYEWQEYAKRNVWVAKSSLSSLSFSAAVDVSLQQTSDQVYPTIAANDNGVFVAWMDYRNDNDKEWTGDASDDSDIYHAKSSNQGTSFSGAARVNDDPTGNKNQQEDPSVAVDGSGNPMVTWTCKRNGDKDIYFAIDSGSGFGINGRANEFQSPAADQLHSSLGFDTGGVPHCVWSDTRNDAGDIYYSHTIPNTAPATPLLYDPDQKQETSMRITWQGNIESDFYAYEVHMSNSSGITPGPGTLNTTIYTQATTEHTVTGLAPGETYYFKLVVRDFDGLSSSSNEVSDFTFNVNQPPRWLKDPPNLEFDEDNQTQGERVINLSDGYFWDDYYGGFAPKFAIETTASNEASGNIKGFIEKIGTFFYVTFKPKSNFAGTERFWLNLSDNGSDGSPDNADDLFASKKEPFDVTTLNINDAPKFDKISSGILWEKKITTFGKVELMDTIEKGRQGQYYNFTISATDIDPEEEMIYKWYRIEPDNTTTLLDTPALNPENPTLASDFSYLPNNDECTNVDNNNGKLSYNVTAEDKGGAEIWFNLVIHFINGNDKPKLTTLIDDAEKETAISSLSGNKEFTVEEGSFINFSVVGIDLDPGDDPVFFSEKPNVKLVTTTEYRAEYDGVENVRHFRANLTYTPDEVDISAGEVKDAKISIDDKHTGYDEIFIDFKILQINDPPEITNMAVKPVVDDNEDFKADFIRNKYWKDHYSNLNPDEELNFSALATDPEKDELTYEWDFGDGKTGEGRFTTHTYTDLGNYTVNVSVSDGEFDVWKTMLVQIRDDGDSDNDGMADEYEIKWFEDLSKTGLEDSDNDGYTDLEESRADSSPLNPKDKPGERVIEDDDDDSIDDKGFKIPAWVVVIIVIALVIAIFIIIVIVLVVKQNRQLEQEDKKLEEEIDKKMKKLEENRELYGLQVAGSQVESNYETSKSVDLDSLSEEEKMFIAVGEGKADDGDIGGASSPQTLDSLESAGDGPLFDSSAPKLQFMEGSSIKLEDMTSSTELEEEDDLVIETVTLGQDGPADMNSQLVSANDRFDNAAEYAPPPQGQQPGQPPAQPGMQPPPPMPGQPPQPGQPPRQPGIPPQ